MVNQAQHSATRLADGITGPARLNQAHEIIAIPWVTQLMLEGRVFIAGHGVEEAGIDGESSLNEQTPSFALSQASSDVIAIPLFFRAYFDTQGGAAPDMHLTYVQADKAIDGAGTAVTAISTLGGDSPRVPSAKCQTSLSGITAITSDQMVVLTERLHILNNFVSTEGATTNAGVEGPGRSTMELVWTPEMLFGAPPFGLRNGASLLFYSSTASTDSKYNYTCMWAEVPGAVYGLGS